MSLLSHTSTDTQYKGVRGPLPSDANSYATHGSRFIAEHGTMLSSALGSWPKRVAYSNAPWAITPTKFLMKDHMKGTSLRAYTATTYADSAPVFRSKLAAQHNSANRTLQLRAAHSAREDAWMEHTTRMNARFQASSARAATARQRETRRVAQALQGEVDDVSDRLNDTLARLSAAEAALADAGIPANRTATSLLQPRGGSFSARPASPRVGSPRVNPLANRAGTAPTPGHRQAPTLSSGHAGGGAPSADARLAELQTKLDAEYQKHGMQRPATPSEQASGSLTPRGMQSPRGIQSPRGMQSPRPGSPRMAPRPPGSPRGAGSTTPRGMQSPRPGSAIPRPPGSPRAVSMAPRPLTPRASFSSMQDDAAALQSGTPQQAWGATEYAPAQAPASEADWFAEAAAMEPSDLSAGAVPAHDEEDVSRDFKYRVLFNAFSAFDVASNGRIAPWDFEQAVAHVNVGLGGDDLHRLVEMCSDAETGEVDYVSFCGEVRAMGR